MGKRTGDYDTSIRTTLKVIEHEVIELRRQKYKHLTQLCLINDSIARRHVLERNLKNWLVPVNRLPNEILLMCFEEAVQDWVDKNDGVDERSVANLVFYEWSGKSNFKLPCTPVFAISHVSHHWRRLVINTPSLWMNLVITPKFQRHLDVFRDFLRRARGMPIAANFRFFPSESEEPLSSAGVSMMEAVMPFIHAQQIKALTFLTSAHMLLLMLSRMVEQTTICPPNPPPIMFSRLTALSIFASYHPEGMSFSHLRRLLSATPQLRTLGLQRDILLDAEERADNTVIALLMLEKLTIIESNPFVCKFLDLLSAPVLHQLKLLMWFPTEGFDVVSCLFIGDNDNFNSGLRVPKFSKVQDLTLSSSYQCEQLGTVSISAFPRITNLTLTSPSLFYESEEPGSLSTPVFQCLQHLTFDFAFEDDRHLFRYYEELQQYGTLDGSSSRLDEFIRWQVRGSGGVKAAMQY
ncbi:hypothetical protein BJ138DRAFT_1102034 [Hygrophoropsis aurantiaca]|uniref:Uncharacterized protein n=1 Tax=Hygrophoropsis aurantiaca TaxID=72124 RepID=A0ACB8AC20_9AGAM|nr:hypothetical protein BJ138DRAFT_1102034 [Hygrophoropsis aurantiaca]